MKKLKINILSAGRFHVLDLARELDKCGYDVKFYSFVPMKRAVFFGLPARCSASLVIPLAPFIFLERKLFPRKNWTSQIRIWVQDRLTKTYMRKCDILISMSGEFVVSLKKAKERGSLIIVERGSKHILEQKRILESIPSLQGKKPVPEKNVKRELECYRIADYISVASNHVVNSFAKHGYNESKIFKNPYGVDISMFKPLPNIEKKYDVIYVGAWSYQKGCDLIINAIKKTSYSFLHVGGINDIDFPINDSRFTHIDKVDQSQLVNYYNQAKVFLLPSRQEGLAMVQAQAIACNLPVVGSLDSGAEDLRDLLKCKDSILIMSELTSDEIIRKLNTAITMYKNTKGYIYSKNSLSKLSWSSYGSRYDKFLTKITKQ